MIAPAAIPRDVQIEGYRPNRVVILNAPVSDFVRRAAERAAHDVAETREFNAAMRERARVRGDRTSTRLG